MDRFQSLIIWGHRISQMAMTLVTYYNFVDEPEYDWWLRNTYLTSNNIQWYEAIFSNNHGKHGLNNEYNSTLDLNMTTIS